MIQLGSLAQDVISGFEGVVTGHCRYLTGCDQYCLLPKSKDGDYKAAQWFDESRIQVVSSDVVVLNAALPNGGPQSHTPLAK